jgi:hypothetical protein
MKEPYGALPRKWLFIHWSKGSGDVVARDVTFGSVGCSQEDAEEIRTDRGRQSGEDELVY